MSKIVTLKQGNSIPVLTATVKDLSGNVIDLTFGGTETISEVRFFLREFNSKVLKIDANTSSGVTVVDAVNGVLKYSWASADLDTPGRYRGEFQVEYVSGKILSAPNINWIIFNILGNLPSGTGSPSSPTLEVPQHEIGGSAHLESTLAELNTKISDGNIDFDSATRNPNTHDLLALHSVSGLTPGDVLTAITPNSFGFAAVPVTVPGGADKHIQFNNSGSFGGSSGLQWDSAQNSLRVQGKIGQTLPFQEILDSSGDTMISFLDEAIVFLGEGNTPTGTPVDGGFFWTESDSLWFKDSSGITTDLLNQVPSAHALGGASHTASTLAALNSLISDATLDDQTASRPPQSHALGGAAHSASTLAALNLLVSDATLDDISGSRPPTSHDIVSAHSASGLTPGDVLTATSPTTIAFQAAAAGAPGGANTQVQFNSAGAFGASSDFTWDDTLKELSVSDTGGPGMIVRFGDGDTFLWEISDDVVRFYAGGVIVASMFNNGSYSSFRRGLTDGWELLTANPTSTVPNILPKSSDQNTGLGYAGPDQLSLIAGGVEGIRISTVASNTNLGFFGASPVAKPTVTGSRAGNAALASLLTELASLGLITDSTSA